ncbi:MAG: hypothetical protein FWF85_07335 [Clostridiales bacterium]|jgi:NADH:ubiquinone oxidoreductase subunit 6 (subunit J)|nr:hypothetical protein [Clostridiales bacterium]MDR2712826.1 hypothetical protein [Clostridiales bacterium]
MNLPILLLLLGLMVVAAVAAVMIRSLLKSAIALAALSIVLAITLFFLGAPLAALFELSVCAGLITVIFISAISLTGNKPKEEEEEKIRERRARFLKLPIFLLIIGVFVSLAWIANGINISGISDPAAPTFQTFKNLFWNMRQVDILGQVIVILAGAFAVVVLFKERDQA